MHLTIFRLNLETVERNSHTSTQTLRSEGDNLQNTRSTWFANNILNNRKAYQLVDGRVYHTPPHSRTTAINIAGLFGSDFADNAINYPDGRYIAAYDEEAIYLKNNFTEGSDAFLTVAYEALVFE